MLQEIKTHCTQHSKNVSPRTNATSSTSPVPISAPSSNTPKNFKHPKHQSPPHINSFTQTEEAAVVEDVVAVIAEVVTATGHVICLNTTQLTVRQFPIQLHQHSCNTHICIPQDVGTAVVVDSISLFSMQHKYLQIEIIAIATAMISPKTSTAPTD